MKNLTLLAGILLILSSCATKKINFDQLQDRNGLFYLVNDKEPFTGEIVSYVAGKVEFEGEVKNGLKEGLWIYYYANGQKEMEGVYRDGLKEGTWSYWADNGEQNDQEVYKYGNRLGHEGPRPDEDGLSNEPDTENNTESSGSVTPNSSGTSLGGTIGSGQKKKEVEPPKPKAVNWDMLTGGPVKFYQGQPYTGPVVKWYKEGTRGKYIDGYFTNGYRSGTWTFYERDGRIKDIKYY
ncbi:MAG: hypothetical protein IH596_06785 [Bacteroidales bacterium]|nr:hypothetical protein [Bacteroidales bacterium]